MGTVFILIFFLKYSDFANWCTSTVQCFIKHELYKFRADFCPHKQVNTFSRSVRNKIHEIIIIHIHNHSVISSLVICCLFRPVFVWKFFVLWQYRALWQLLCEQDQSVRDQITWPSLQFIFFPQIRCEALHSHIFWYAMLGAVCSGWLWWC